MAKRPPTSTPPSFFASCGANEPARGGFSHGWPFGGVHSIAGNWHSAIILSIYSAVASRVRTIREIEIKLRITDLAAILGKIRGLGVRSSTRTFEQNTLYDTPESDFRRRGRLLRLRVETHVPYSSSSLRSHPMRRDQSHAILTSKLPAPNMRSARFKEKIETEVTVHDERVWRRAVHKLGLSEGFRYEKYRTSFTVGEVHLDLDETPVGNFLEVEGPPIEIDRIARRLGFRPRDYIRATYWDLYAAKCRRAARKPGNMLFAT